VTPHGKIQKHEFIVALLYARPFLASMGSKMPHENLVRFLDKHKNKSDLLTEVTLIFILLITVLHIYFIPLTAKNQQVLNEKPLLFGTNSACFCYLISSKRIEKIWTDAFLTAIIYARFRD
jgi:hypothetical protein